MSDKPTEFILERLEEYSRETVIAELKRVAYLEPEGYFTTGKFLKHSRCSVPTVCKYLKSWHDALVKAGMEARSGPSAQGRHTNEQCFENLLRVWTRYGRQPMYKEMSYPPSKLGVKAYIDRWGTWNKALHAFVKFAEGDYSESATRKTV